MKNILKENERNADDYYGKLVRANAQAEEMQERQKREEAKKRQGEYSKTLEEQMQTNYMMRNMDTVMTEHERRVNDGDIRAYQHQDKQNLYHKLPGIKLHGEELQDKYIDKIFNNTTAR